MKYRFKASELGVFKEKEAKRAASMLAKDSISFGFTDGMFSLIDLIHELLKIIGKADIVLSTWSAGIKDSHQVKWMLDTDLINSIKIITDKSFPSRQRNYALALTELFGEENIRISSIHAKFVLISNENWKICLFSSMNLNANNNIENFVIAEGVELFDFVAEFCNKHFEDDQPGFFTTYASVKHRLAKIFSSKQRKAEWWEQ
jgi:hypothetical protein